MAYADQTMSGNKIAAIIIVGLIHVAVGYALVTGLAYSAVQKAIERVTTVDIDEPEPPEPEDEPPPPPPEQTAPPPPVAPPPPISVATSAPQIVTQPNIPPPAPVVREIIPAPVAPVAPPPPKFPPKDPQPRGNTGRWVTTNDYPSRALREEREGTTRVNLTVNTDGRVTNCVVTSSSGHSDLDEAVCKNATRRARFRSATNGDGQEVTGTYSFAVRWQMPEDY